MLAADQKEVSNPTYLRWIFFSFTEASPPPSPLEKNTGLRLRCICKQYIRASIIVWFKQLIKVYPMLTVGRVLLVFFSPVAVLSSVCRLRLGEYLKGYCCVKMSHLAFLPIDIPRNDANIRLS
jgi:hypothetical protein